MVNPKERKRIGTTQTAFDIIEYVKKNPSCRLNDIDNDIDISKSTLHTHLQTLCEMGYLIKEEQTYRLGLPFLTLGGHVQNTSQYGKICRVAKPEVDELAEQTGDRAQVVIEEGGKGYYLYQSSGNQAVMVDTHIGTQIPLNSTAVGKSILAYIPEERTDQILKDAELVADTPNTITEEGRLYDQLDEIRERGFALDREERVMGICCVAAPILTDQEEVLGGISVSLPKKRAEESYFIEKLPEMVVNAGRIIGLNATYS